MRYPEGQYEQLHLFSITTASASFGSRLECCIFKERQWPKIFRKNAEKSPIIGPAKKGVIR